MPPTAGPPQRLQQELIRVHDEELLLQRHLRAQRHTLQRLAEAATGLVESWRYGATVSGDAATRAGGHDGAFAHAHTPARHPRMDLYSLGELLQLWAANTHPSDVTAAARPARVATPPPCPEWRSHARVAAPPPPCALIHDNQDGDPRAAGPPPSPPPPRPLTPAELIRHRLLDASCPLPVTHPLLLGSVEAESFDGLLVWLMTLTRECVEALLLCRPDTRDHPTRAVATGAAREPRYHGNGDRGGPTATGTTESRERHVRRPRSHDGVGSCGSGNDVVGEPWMALCASMVRVLSYAAAVTAPLVVATEQPPSADMPASPLSAGITDAVSSAALRADLRLFLADVVEVRTSVVEVGQWCCAGSASHAPPCAGSEDDEGPQSKVSRGEVTSTAASPPARSTTDARCHQTAALHCMASLVHLAARVETQVRQRL
ncbi:hypothetical protein NESM_000416900 [Novymonas esmeraldas]|uniref:Uncharacterized protein n=1 Tax=Novymonas esmeraldas TaxID=1808958 RepID=A0AAW0ENJ1_9TRYP